MPRCAKPTSRSYISRSVRPVRVLNAFYQYLTEQDGKEPMPIEVFKERKKMINELSKRLDNV